MGGFLLVRREPNLDLDEAEKAVRDSVGVFDKKGLSLNKKVVTSEFIIYVFNKRRAETENVILFDKGDFVIATGTLIYDRKVGVPALKQLFADFSTEEQKCFSRLSGQYCVIISKEKKLFLFNAPIGLYRVYSNHSKSVISSSFLAVLKSLQKRSIEEQEFFEYIFEGAYYGDQTLITGIILIDTMSILQLSPSASVIPKSISFQRLKVEGSFDDMLGEVSTNLIDYFDIIQKNFGNSVCAGLTAGVDTRLMLACMRKVGIEPYLYVYGDADSPNVRIAKMITQGEHLKLDHEDRREFPQIGREEFTSFLEKQFYMIDGLGNLGIFDNGSDLSTRLKRIERARLQLNGAGDFLQIYYSLPDKPLSVNELLKAEYDHSDYAMCRMPYFNKRMYFSSLAAKITKILGVEDERIDRQLVEMLLPLFRARYWTGFNHMINNQLADALCPYYEPRFVYFKMDVPYKDKYLNAFQAALIKLIDPAVSKYPSQYGYTFYDYDKISLWIKAKTYVRYHVPPGARPYLRAHFKNKGSKNWFPYYLSSEYLETVFSLRQLSISEYIDVDKITDLSMLSRVLSVELLMTDRF